MDGDSKKEKAGKELSVRTIYLQTTGRRPMRVTGRCQRNLPIGLVSYFRVLPLISSARCFKQSFATRPPFLGGIGCYHSMRGQVAGIGRQLGRYMGSYCYLHT